MDSKRALIDFVCKNFLVEEDEIDLDASLIDQGIIDSFGLIEISSFLKKEFTVETAEEEMTRDNYGSIEKLVAFIERKKGA